MQEEKQKGQKGAKRPKNALLPFLLLFALFASSLGAKESDKWVFKESRQ
jgi:hypothetical protein